MALRTIWRPTAPRRGLLLSEASNRSLLAGKQVRQVSAGWGHSMVLLWDGTVLSCGRNYRGQLGIDPATCPTNQRGHLYNPTFSTVLSLAGINIEQISCGGEPCCHCDRRSLYIWGDDACAQLAQAGDLSQVYGEDEPKFRAVATRAVGSLSWPGSLASPLAPPLPSFSRVQWKLNPEIQHSMYSIFAVVWEILR